MSQDRNFHLAGGVARLSARGLHRHAFFLPPLGILPSVRACSSAAGAAELNGLVSGIALVEFPPASLSVANHVGAPLAAPCIDAGARTILLPGIVRIPVAVPSLRMPRTA